MLESSTSISVERAALPFAFEAALFFDQGGEEEGLIEEEGEGKERKLRQIMGKRNSSTEYYCNECSGTRQNTIFNFYSPSFVNW